MKKIILALALAAAGCGPNLPNKVTFAGQSANLQSGCQVNFQDAWARAHEVKIKLWVANMSQAFMMVNRDGFALRLPDGRVIPRDGVIAYNTDPRERSVGEIPLVSNGEHP